MGFECDQEMVQMIGTDENTLTKLYPCIEESRQAQVYTQTQVNFLMLILLLKQNILIRFSNQLKCLKFNFDCMRICFNYS